ncbi:hypothetical protein BLNAU_2906 [Blattamonas nauphoetae]|uniref:Uncharacterized protein n=1 Tax=Blattamonas nauphoetae TaxID=2049346 RepID=A0ABQ9YEQ3_9EUKA|nr:hypothetical protein BLNAU_2906 [Blattamonas nauphoetae]
MSSILIILALCHCYSAISFSHFPFFIKQQNHDKTSHILQHPNDDGDSTNENQLEPSTIVFIIVFSILSAIVLAVIVILVICTIRVNKRLKALREGKDANQTTTTNNQTRNPVAVSVGQSPSREQLVTNQRLSGNEPSRQGGQSNSGAQPQRVTPASVQNPPNARDNTSHNQTSQFTSTYRSTPSDLPSGGYSYSSNRYRQSPYNNPSIPTALPCAPD